MWKKICYSLFVIIFFLSYSSYSFSFKEYKKIREKWTITKRIYDKLVIPTQRSIEEEDLLKTGSFYGVEATLTFMTKELIEGFLNYRISELKLNKEEAEELRNLCYQEYMVEDYISFVLHISNQSQKGLICLKKFSDRIVLIDSSGNEYRPLKYDSIFDEEFAGDICGKIYFPKIIKKGTKWIRIILTNIYSEKEANIYYKENFFEFSYKIPSDISSIIYSGGDEIKKENFKIEKKEPAEVKISKNELEKVLEEGLNFYKNGEFENSIKKFQEALEIDRNNILSLNMLGLAYLKKGLIDAAIYTFSKAIQIDPFISLSYYNQGLAYYEKKDIERAIISFSQAVNLNTKYTDAHYYLGLCYEEIKEYEKALKEYEEVLKLSPEHELAKKGIFRIKKKKNVS